LGVSAPVAQAAAAITGPIRESTQGVATAATASMQTVSLPTVVLQQVARLVVGDVVRMTGTTVSDVQALDAALQSTIRE
jgi:hypothetical protein